VKRSEIHLKDKADSFLSLFRQTIGETCIRSISYVQIDPLSRLYDPMNAVEFETKTGQINGLFFQADLIAKAYYKYYFPNLIPASFMTEPGIDMSSEDNNLQPIALKNAIPEGHNALIIPVFAALNRVAIFIIDLNENQPARDLSLASVLLNAQLCHLNISQAQNEINIEQTRLTQREKETLQCVVKGQSNSEIAATLGLSLHTVTGYLRNIFLKTHTTDRTSAAIFAVHKGLLSDFTTETTSSTSERKRASAG